MRKLEVLKVGGGSKEKKKEKKKHFVSWKAYFSCYFFVTSFHLHFKDDF